MSVHKDTRNNTWYVKYKNTTRRGFKTKKEAQRCEVELKFTDNTNTPNTITFSQVANDYLEHIKKHVTIGTYEKSYGIIHKIILPNIKDKRMSSILNIQSKCNRKNKKA